MSYLKRSLFTEQVHIVHFSGENDDNDPPIHHVQLRCRIGKYAFTLSEAHYDLERARKALMSEFTGFCRALHIEYDEEDFLAYFSDLHVDPDLPF